MSFNTALDEIKAALGADAALNAFCTAKWGSGITVKRVFRQRIEIPISSLPIILMTRPEATPGSYMNGEREYRHIVRLYAGFHQSDAEKAQEELVEFEELIEDALLSFRESNRFPEGVEDILPGESVNDEGRKPPVYFLVKDIEVEARRTTGG